FCSSQLKIAITVSCDSPRNFRSSINSSLI
ncbi:hypothetical protein AZZ66_004036, partial [Escherichia coli]